MLTGEWGGRGGGRGAESYDRMRASLIRYKSFNTHWKVRAPHLATDLFIVEISNKTGKVLGEPHLILRCHPIPGDHKEMSSNE